MIFKDMMTGAGDFVQKVIKSGGGIGAIATKTADILQVAGKIKLPLTSEINSLYEKSEKLRSLGYQLEDAGRFAQQLQGYKGNAAVLNQSISLISEAKRAKAQIDATDKLLAGAIAEGKATQQKMLAGKLPLTATAPPL